MAKTGAAAPATGSTMVRRQLGRKLRQLREACGKTREDVVATRLMSLGKLKSIEYGRSMVRPGDVYELGRLYGTPPEAIEDLRHLAIATTQEGWWEPYGEGLLKGFNTYLDLESYATGLWAYEPGVIHGLLQTEDYALAVERASARPGTDEATIQNLVRVRLTRQRTLRDREQPARLRIVLGEAALRLRVGGPDVMAGQRERLRREAERDDLDVRVLTDDAGPHPALHGNFAVMDFDDPDDPSVVYTEASRRVRLDDREAEVAWYRALYQAIHAMATPLEEYLT
jgi:hypothetical protein